MKLQEADEKEAKQVIKKNITPLRRFVAKYAAKRAKGYGKLSASEVKKILARYLKTGKLSKAFFIIGINCDEIII